MNEGILQNRPEKAEEIAARTVSKHRREEGRTPSKRTQGTGNPSTRLEERTVQELRNIAAELDIEVRSKMLKGEFAGRHHLLDA